MKNTIYPTILAIFSLFINQYIANRGVFPIDSFLIFDAAFNILSGNHPFKDYWLISGPFVDYIQSLFFLIFGINWTSYVMHASALNMALALFSFYYFLNIGLKNFYAFIYADFPLENSYFRIKFVKSFAIHHISLDIIAPGGDISHVE